MKMLLDTHILLWYVMGDSRLNNRVKEIINAKSELSFSIASLWEIAIKVNIGNLQLNCSFEDLLARLLHINAEILPISIEDIQIYMNLPLPPNHRDPFDRILVAQTMNRSLVLVSSKVF
jgi:PIN domain nuclease of toxin-antitoxin system